MGRSSFSRSDRLASTIQKELAEMINGKQLKELKDDRLNCLISVVEVRVTQGYQHLDVFLSVFEEKKKPGVLDVLKLATSSMRGEICRRCKLRVAPTLVFHVDDSIKRGSEIWGLLDKIQNESDQ